MSQPHIVSQEIRPLPKFPFPFPKNVDARISTEALDGITKELRGMIGDQKAVVARVAAD